MRNKFAYALTLAFGVAAPVASADSTEIYNDFYKHFNPASELEKDGQNPPDDIASWPFFASEAEAFGGIIGFDNSTNKLDTFSTIMSNWNGWDPDGGVGTATEGFQTELTLELFEVDRSGTTPAPGAPLVEDTETHDIAGRQIPDADNASFVGNGTDFVVDWNLDGLSVGDELLFMVRVDGLVGKGFGNPPSNSALQSLNIAAADIEEPIDVTAGLDTDPGIFWRSDANTNGNISRFTANAFNNGELGGGQVFARATSIPLPGTLVLFLAGLVGIGVTYGAHRRKAFA